MIVITEYGRRCMCCGASPEDGKTTIQVDHILPVSEYWHRRLDPTNLQVLCEACNKGKGAWDHTDWRPKHI